MKRYETVFRYAKFTGTDLLNSEKQNPEPNRRIFFLASVILLISFLNACGNKSDQTSTTTNSDLNKQSHTFTPSAPLASPPAANPATTSQDTLTVSLLEERGARKLTTKEVLALIVDHSIVFQHLGTGEYFEAIFLKNGLRLLTDIDAGSLEGETLQDAYMVENDRLQTNFKGRPITTTVYQLDQRYLAAVDNDNGAVNYEIRDILKAPFTAQVLKSQNARVLSTDEIKQLFVGKTLLIKDLLSGDEYLGNYGENGLRTLQYVNPTTSDSESGIQKTQDPYQITNGKLHSIIDGNEVASTIFELESHYYGALSFDEGAVNYEFIPQ